MINIIKMDFFRLAKSKSTYIIAGILAVMYLFMTALDAESLNNIKNNAEYTEDANSIKLYEANYNSEYVANSDNKASMLAGAYSGNITAMALIIFSGLFAGGYRKNRFEKNIRGVVGQKYKLIVSNFVVCTFFAMIIMVFGILFSMLGYAIFYPNFYNLSFGNTEKFIFFIITYYLLLVCLCVMNSVFVEIVGNQIIAVVVALIYGSGIIYDIIDFALFSNLSEFSIKRYLPIGNIYELTIESSTSIFVKGIILAICFSVIAVFSHIIIKEKQDIVC